MSATTGWFHTTSTVGTTRRYMAGAFVGALLLLGAGAITGWPALPGPSAKPDSAAVAANAAVGTCLTWTRPDASDLVAVDCGQAHLFEVTGTADVSAQYPSGAPFPDETTWQKAAQASCAPDATRYLGKLDPFGRYVVGALKPTSGQWNSGDRTLRCGVQRATPSGQLQATTGSAKGADQSNVYSAGTCLALLNKAAGGPAPCGNQHSYEIVGTVSLRDKFPGGYPPVDQQQTALAQLCRPIVAAYTGGADLATYQLSTTWDTIRPESWDAGSYQVNCKIGALLPDGSGLGPVTNSVHGIGRAPSSVAASPTAADTSGGG